MKQPTFRPFAVLFFGLLLCVAFVTFGLPSCSMEGPGQTCSHVCDDDEHEGCEEPCGFECDLLFDDDEWIDDHFEYHGVYGSPSVRVGSAGHARGYYHGGKR